MQRGLRTESVAPPDVIKRQGEVLHVTDRVATVELYPAAGCAGCEQQRRLGFGPGHCGIDLLGLSKSAQRSTVEIPINLSDQTPARTGDTVEVHIQAPNARWLALACQVYAVPTLGLILGATVGTGVSEPCAIVLAALGLCAGSWLGRRSVHVPPSMAELCGTGTPAMRIVNIALEARS